MILGLPFASLRNYKLRAHYHGSHKETGTDVPHVKMTATVTVKQAGYIYIYYSNEESTTYYEAFFDDFKVTHTKSPVIQAEDYYPFGLVASSYQRENSLEQNYLYNGKELQDELNLGWLDYGFRMYMPEIGRFSAEDIMSEEYYSWSPYNYVRGNPITRLDPNGKWDITVHLYNDREQYGYGVAIVTDRHGNEIYRFDVRGQGVKGRDRRNIGADTPLGVYDIPNKYKDMWKSSKSVSDRQSYGPNDRLIMENESGEIWLTFRNAIRIHGGQQEKYDKKTNTWTPVVNPILKETEGCLRAYDSDMAELQNIVKSLMNKDNKEYGGKVYVRDDLQRKSRRKVGLNPYNIQVTTYYAPGDDASDEERSEWTTFVNRMLGIK